LELWPTTSFRSAAASLRNEREVASASTRDAIASSGRNQNAQAESDGPLKRIAHSEQAILRRKVARPIHWPARTPVLQCATISARSCSVRRGHQYTKRLSFAIWSPFYRLSPVRRRCSIRHKGMQERYRSARGTNEISRAEAAKAPLGPGHVFMNEDLRFVHLRNVLHTPV